MRTLAAEVYGHDNHFNLIRLVAASLVIFSHAFAIATGTARSEPLRADFGVTFGSIAVDIFFVTSGLLVTASLCRKKSAVSFAAARFFRIIPGLAVMMLITVFVMAPLFTSLSVSEYFSSRDTWRYLYKNLSLVGYGVDALPGVFTNTPMPGPINGSLWTLPFEVRCYATLLLLWMLARGGRAFSTVVLATAAVFTALHLQALTEVSTEKTPWRLYAMFSIGAAFFVLRRFVPLGWVAGAVGLLMLAIGVLHRPWFGVLYSLSLPILVVWAAYLPGAWLRQFNRLGDFSYGTYVYGWPTQQVTVSLVPGIGALPLFYVAWPVAVALAALSWRWVEKPSMALGRRFIDRPTHRAASGVASLPA